jgi:uncharacterized protein YvpB
VSHSSSRRRPSPLFALLALGGVVVTILAGALLGLWSWQQAGQIQALQRETLAHENEHEQAREQLAALRETASALEQRLASTDPSQEDLAQPVDEAVTTADQLAELQSHLEQIDSRLDRDEATLAEALGRVQALEDTPDLTPEPLPSQARLVVPLQKQSHNLSCESSAAAMAAQYHGISLTEAQVLAALPRADNPNLGFRGNVDGPPGGIQDYGVYAAPILDILNANGLKARLVEGGAEGIKAAIARGNPVLAWITYNCQASTPVATTVDGQVLNLVPYQHTVVVTGYDGGGVWTNDPWDGQVDYYATADFRRALAYFDDMAIEVAAP